MSTLTVRALFPIGNGTDSVQCIPCVTHSQTSLAGRTTTEGASVGVIGDESLATGLACPDNPANRARFVLAGVTFRTGKLTLTRDEWRTFDPASAADDAEREAYRRDRETESHRVAEAGKRHRARVSMNTERNATSMPY